MHHPSSSLFLYRGTAFLLGFAILAVSLGGSFGLIYIRDQIARSAGSSARLEVTLKELERDNVRLSAQISRAHQPAFLQAQMPQGMEPTAEARVVWIEAPRHHTPLRGDPLSDPMDLSPRESPLVISFDLALMNNRSGQLQ